MKLKIAVLQYDCPEETDASVVKLTEIAGQASFMGAKLVIAPETAIANLDNLKKGKEINIFGELSKIAKNNGIYLITSYYAKEDGKIYEFGHVINPEGDSILRHRKIYLANHEIDDIGALPGDRLEVAESEYGKVGMLICKDGFNKYSHYLFEKLGELGANIIFVPSWSIGWKELETKEYVKGMFTYGSFLSRAFVLVADTTNKFYNSYGQSLVISPVRGVIRQANPERKEIIIEELDLDEVKKAREFDGWWQPSKRII